MKHDVTCKKKIYIKYLALFHLIKFDKIKISNLNLFLFHFYRCLINNIFSENRYSILILYTYAINVYF